VQKLMTETAGPGPRSPVISPKILAVELNDLTVQAAHAFRTADILFPLPIVLGVANSRNIRAQIGFLVLFFDHDDYNSTEST